MAIATMLKEIARLREEVGRHRPTAKPIMELLRADPARILTEAAMTPDPWQATLLRSRAKRLLLLGSRQAGKSTVAAALAMRAALLEPPALVLLLSPSLRQSGELFRDKVLRQYNCPRLAGRGRPGKPTAGV